MKHFLELWKHVINFLTSAMFWIGFGLDVIPVMPNTKRTAVKWDPWLNSLDPQKVHEYWTQNPGHELGCIVGDDMIVYDADSKEAVLALVRIESRFGVMPKMVVNTTKGQHHYFRRTPGTVAKSDSHNSEKYPDRIDVKTGRALVVLPKSTGKTIRILEVENKRELSIAPQEFINAIYEHNGRTAPSNTTVVPFNKGVTDTVSLQKIESLLKHINPDCGYEDWLRVCMAIYHETGGSEEGMALFDKWSSGGKKYKGSREITNKWRSFRTVESPVTGATLIKMAKDAGADVTDIMGDAFQPCEYEVILPDMKSDSEKSDDNPLTKYCLRDINELEKLAVNQVQVFGNIALLGQATVIYARQNTGKTLLTFHFIIEGIKAGKFDPSKLIYINMDDDSNGLAVKARIAEEYGFRMVADGHQGFEAKKFRVAMEEMIKSDTAQGVIVVLDTLKKFVNIMDKGKSANFAKVVRQFVLKGGTVIALSHTNKHPGSDGKQIYGGTTDIIDDFDCGYILNTISEDPDNDIKIVELDNIKRRGNVALTVSYSYALSAETSYPELLLSVKEVDDTQLISVKKANEMASDAEIIKAVKKCISEGITTKMKLAEAAAERSLASKRQTLKVIDKYTGNDPEIHEWHFTYGKHGAKIYELLTPFSEELADPDIVDF